jgi:hypothetical protein
VESVLDFVGDQLYLVTVAAFAVASLGIISWSRRRQPRSSGRFGLAGLRTAAIASVVSVVILALLLIIGLNLIGGLVGSGYTTSTPQPVDPAGLARDSIIGLLWLVSIPGVTFLAVLDLYAVRPPRPEDQAGVAKWYAVLGTLCSLLLMGGALLVPVLIDDAAASAAASKAARDAREETDNHTREVEARSAGLALEVSVVDAELGAPTDGGKIVEQLTLDITVRSATEIELRQGPDGFGSNGLLLDPAYAPDAGYTPPMSLELKGLPTVIPAGFSATYRLDVPVDGTLPEADPVTTGPWSARLVLYDRSPGRTFKTSVGSITLWYETSTDFTVFDMR